MPATDIIMEPAINAEVRVPGKAAVKVRITIGRSGQAAQSIISVKGAALVNRADGFTQDLGSGDSLDGKLVHITTVITDVAAAHNDVSFKLEMLADGRVVFTTERMRVLATSGGGMQVTSYISMLAD